MLLINNLSKTYRTNNQTVEALNNVNLSLEDKGFVVLLGKSGSGKSTLLNLIGGLDSFDSGEISIKGICTKHFKSGDWDSYRNTYVGVVFQEFYLIEEFTIGKNIALALELQGYPKETIEIKVDEILNHVHLGNYKNRKPNELSGGEKQRIAIARALVKNPKIILADEPTGNLDSENGKIILNILKKLSKDKLVIMVTHDTEFAYMYGDRIIELKDGKVISDFINNKIKEEIIYDVNKEIKKVIKLPKGKKLTSSMIDYINNLLVNSDDKLYISYTNKSSLIKKFVPDIDSNKEEENEINCIKVESEDEEFNLKKTAIPFKYAFSLAINSLIMKKFKLVLMLILFIASLVFLGMSTSYSFYDVSKASYLTFKKANINYIPVDKKVFYCDNLDNIRKELCYGRDSFTESEIEKLKSKYPNIEFITSYGRYIPLSELVSIDEIKNEGYYIDAFSKVTILDETKMNFKLLTGEYPNFNEVLITDYMAEMFLVNNIYNINNVNDLVGKNIFYNDREIKISGIVKTDYDKYDYLKTETDYNNLRGFFIDRNNIYVSIFMNKDTYSQSFYKNHQRMNLFYNSINDEKNIYGLMSGINNHYNDDLIGRLPQNDNEIVISLKSMIEDFEYEIDYPNITNNDLENNYLNKTIKLSYREYYDSDSYNKSEYKDYIIVGILNDYENSKIDLKIMFSNNEFKKLDDSLKDSYWKTWILMDAILGSNNQENINFLSYLDKIHYEHITKYSNELYIVKHIASQITPIFNIASAIFALFSAVLIFSIIATSINIKQKEIGTLRAIGARGRDVGKIFIIEGMIIAIFSSFMATIINIFITNMLNNNIIKQIKLDIVVLYTNFTSIMLIFAVSIFIVFISTFIPIRRITIMKPIKAIKGLK